jgi:hypothetical protein
MGIFDDPIREHLELKRKRSSEEPESEVPRALEGALGAEEAGLGPLVPSGESEPRLADEAAGTPPGAGGVEALEPEETVVTPRASRRAPDRGAASRRLARAATISRRALYWLAVLLVAAIMVVGLILVFELVDSSSVQP